jgi:arylsulfatase
MIFSGDETCDIGSDTGTQVTPDYPSEGGRFTGTINWVQIDLGGEDSDHLITADERIRVAMARQ